MSHRHNRVSGPEYPPEWDLEPRMDVRCDEYPCGSCGLLFFFAGPVPDASWRCRACRPIPPEVSDEIGAHQYEMDRGDAA